MIKRQLKKIIKALPQDMVVPMFGSLFGKKWILGSANIRNWLALDEKEVQECFKKYIKKGDVVYDVGSNVGFYALLGSSLVGPTGKVFAFEPVPELYSILLKHLQINDLRNVEAKKVAVSDKSGQVSFSRGVNTSSGHIGEGELRVEAFSIDDMIERHGLPEPDFLKIDVEGHELGVLKGMERLLSRRKDIVIHLEADASRTEIFEFLRQRGYVIERLDKENIVALP